MTATETATSPPVWGSGLLNQHRHALESSAVSIDVALERGYRSVTEKATLERAGFSPAQHRVPGLLIPLFSVAGDNAGYQYRPDQPRIRNGKPIKYETRAGQHAVIDAHPRLVAQLRDPAVPLWITEGTKKADSAVSLGLCCVALSGVWNWRGTNDAGGKTALPDWDDVALNDRPVVLAFDSDSTSKVSVYDALQRLKEFLEHRGAHVHIAHLHDTDDGAKIGLDDLIASQNITTRAELETHLTIDRSLGERPHIAKDLPIGADGHHLTDTGNADRLIGAHGTEVRFVPAWGQWLAWDDTRWRPDHRDVRVTELTKDVARQMWQHITTMPADKNRDRHIAWAKTSESATTIANAVKLARGLPGVAIDHDLLDADPWTLNAVNGIIDLRTGQLGPHDPDALHTRQTGTWWDATAEAPRFAEFLERIMPDSELRSFLQRAVGYSLTGLTGEQCMFLLIGDGANGKSTMVDVVTKMLGDYAGTAAKDLLINQRHESHPTSAADLFRLRFASAVETEATNTLAEARVKSLTGGDRIKARRMREDFWEFEPTHKIFLAANYLPKVTGTDLGIWRRLRVIPFTETIAETERDPHLPAALAEELPGILQWAVEGCLAWQQHGLTPPQSVLDATENYRLESDWFAAFIGESGLDIGQGLSITAKDLTDTYRSWATSNGEVPMGRISFAKELRGKNCRDVRNGSARAWLGIGRVE